MRIPIPPDRTDRIVATVQSAADSWSPQHTLAWAFETFGNRVAISSAFGAEGMVLIDLASRVQKDFRLFTIDTEFLFPETYVRWTGSRKRIGMGARKFFRSCPRRSRSALMALHFGVATLTGAAICGR